MRAVADAGPLIHLSWIGRLDILEKLFDEVLVPLAVAHEVTNAPPHVPGLAELRSAFEARWLETRAITDHASAIELRQHLDAGEAEAIVLMREANADLLLIDDRRGRREALQRKLPFTGTIGLLRAARDRGWIPLVGPLLEDLRRRGFRVSPQLLEQIRDEER